MAIYSGKDAYVNNVPCTQNWSANPGVAHQRYSSSCVPGGTNAPPGVINWTGQMAGVGAQPPVFPTGVDLAFQGVMNNTVGSLRSLTGTILIEQLTIDINKEAYAPISWVATFGGQGALAQAASGAADATVSEAPNGKDLAIKIATVAITSDLRTAQLVFRRPHTTYVLGGVTYRVAGNLECDINFAVHESSLEIAAFAPNALSLLEVFVTASTAWKMQKIRFGPKSGFVVDRVSHAIQGYTVNGMWNGAETGALGYILGPDATAYYGVAP